MSNLYCRPSVVMARVAGQTYSSSHADLADYVRDIELASREFDGHTGRPLYALTATRYFHWTGAPNHDRRRLMLRGDLAAITTLTVDDNDDGTYELTLVDGTDYVVEPSNRESNRPIRSLYLLRTGTQLAAWPLLSRCVKIVGSWGYSAEWETVSGATATVANSSTTTLTASAAADNLIDVGETLLLESEQVYVSAVSGTSVTIRRAENGTTGASHAGGTVIYRRRYPRDVELSVADQVRRMRWRSQQGYDGQVVDYAPEGRREWAAIRAVWDRYVDAGNAGSRLGVA